MKNSHVWYIKKMFWTPYTSNHPSIANDFFVICKRRWGLNLAIPSCLSIWDIAAPHKTVLILYSAMKRAWILLAVISLHCERLTGKRRGADCWMLLHMMTGH